MDKNTIVAVVVIFLLVLVFQFLFLRPKIEQQNEQRAQELQGQMAEQEKEKLQEKEKPEETKLATSLPTPGKEAEVKVISVETRHYSIKISTAGARIVSLRLKDYMDKNGMPVDLVAYDDEDEILPFEVHFDRLKNLPFGDRTPFYVQKLSDLAWVFYQDFKDKNGVPFRFSKSFVFQDDAFAFDLQLKIEALNPGDELYLNQDNISYTMAWGPVLGPTSVIRNRYNITTEGYHEAGKFHKMFRGAAGCSLRRGESRYSEISRTIDWLGVENRYFLIGIVPDQQNYIFSFDQRTQGKYFLGISRAFFKGQELEDSFKVYVGPKDRKLLRAYGHDFESVMSARVLKPIVIFLEWMIRGFYQFTKSYGLSIVLMTIVIKIILYPLTFKSFQSMRKMSALQPKINEIKAQYKNNSQQMNREVQALYKREKVNPMGGCLPMILQMPIFYGLYTALSSMIELRNQPFLWIKDLSLPDTVATIKMAVPLLGYKIGGQGFTDINVLPFVMTATTLLQSKLTSGDQSNQQAKMMTYLFPLMFFFIFWNMPSGLVLYWTIQNILTIGQQYLIDYRLKHKTVQEPVPEKKGKQGRLRASARRIQAPAKRLNPSAKKGKSSPKRRKR